ncbi:hypothetical protein [Rhodophyticola porphyridii]|uniref:Aminoglycoside phosphotransferase n=1 Tax=Rhodophyticola porphyridii TaxID=1852017 RepID=A0A3L9Y420_9RHOB|nr:hypothetical protein [Rhodophyticola porphyridii]RMA43551.1 hypothetical protein D9R08_01005 [Rhodophyticola porphyridii]
MSAKIDEFLKPLGWAEADRTPLPADASARYYLQFHDRVGNQTAILMIAPPDEEFDRFRDIAAYLKAHGLSAPARLPHLAPERMSDMLAVTFENMLAVTFEKLSPGADAAGLRQEISGRQGPDRVGLPDFQLAATGPAGYDLFPLLDDAHRDVPEPLRADLIALHEAAPGLDPAVFRLLCALRAPVSALLDHLPVTDPVG